LYYRQTKSTKDPEKLPRQMFLADKRKKTKNKIQKTDLLKSLKRKRLTKTKKRMVSSKSTGLKSRDMRVLQKP